MFPLGTVLLPGMFLPLHLFEPRYLALARHCLDGDREFGVVLIERGSEVGGDDVRTDVGTVARIVEAVELDDGRWVLGAVGHRRIRVRRWLDDDPFPLAEVEDWPDADVAPPPAGAFAETVAALRRVLALRSELGEPAPPATVELPDEPVMGTYQVAAVGPFGPADRQRLLATDGAEARLRTLRGMLDEEARFLGQRLAMG